MLVSSRKLLIAASIIVCLLALGLRYRSTAPATFYILPPTSSSTLPAFTSARFENGDPLKSLGPEWTFERQSEMSARDAAPLNGIVAQRQSVVKVVGKQTELMLTEFNIVDKAILRASLAKKSVTKIAIAGRDGFIVPVPGLEGGTGFIIVGETTALLMEDGQSALWPQTSAPEILSYIANVSVR